MQRISPPLGPVDDIVGNESPLNESSFLNSKLGTGINKEIRRRKYLRPKTLQLVRNLAFGKLGPIIQLLFQPREVLGLGPQVCSFSRIFGAQE
jgi:hypothetical protein